MFFSPKSLLNSIFCRLDVGQLKVISLMPELKPAAMLMKTRQWVCWKVIGIYIIMTYSLTL